MICNLHQKSTWCKDRYQVEFKISLFKVQFYEICTYLLYYKGRCLSVCQHLNVQTLTSPPILKLWDTQGYLWLPYDLTEVIKLFGVTFKQKNFFFQKKYFMSFLPPYCHSFRITVIPSVLLSFLPDFCHSFRFFVIPSVLKLLDTQGYLWLPYDLTEVIKLIGERFEPKKYFLSKKYFMSFLPH